MSAANHIITTSLVLAAALAAKPANATDLDTSSYIDAVTVYPDGANVTRVIMTDLPSGDSTLVASDFPPGLDPASLRVEGEAGTALTIGAIDTLAPRLHPPVNLPELDKRIEALEDQNADLQDVIAAAEARRKFAERFAEDSPVGLGDKGEARPLSEWRSAFAAVSEEVAIANAAIREAQRKQRDIHRELAQLKGDRLAKPSSKFEVRISLASAAATKATLRVTYAIRHARWVPIYDARLDTGAKDRKPSFELVRRAEVTQNSGEDWSNVSLAVSTVRVARGADAPDLDPVIVQYVKPPVYAPVPAAAFRSSSSAAGSPMVAAAAPPPASEPPAPRLAELQRAIAEVEAFQVTFRIPGRVSVDAGKGAKNLLISTKTIDPDLVVRSAPAVDPTGFLQASFVHGDDAPLLTGQVALYRDAMFVGRGMMPAASKGEPVRLGFGADDKVKIEHAVVSRNEGSSGLIVTTSKTDERAFKTTVRNGHDFPIKVAIEDQLPVSENQEIVVDMLPSTTPPTATNLRDKRGLLQWTFETKPGEVKDIAFAWRIRWPKDKNVVLTPGY